MVLIISGIVLASLFLGAGRGLLWAWLRTRRNRRKLRTQSVMEDLYGLALRHPDPGHAHNFEVLRAMSQYQGGVRRSLHALADEGLAREVSPGNWSLTESGLRRAGENRASQEQNRS